MWPFVWVLNYIHAKVLPCIYTVLCYSWFKKKEKNFHDIFCNMSFIFILLCSKLMFKAFISSCTTTFKFKFNCINGSSHSRIRPRFAKLSKLNTWNFRMYFIFCTENFKHIKWSKIEILKLVKEFISWLQIGLTWLYTIH